MASNSCVVYMPRLLSSSSNSSSLTILTLDLSGWILGTCRDWGLLSIGKVFTFGGREGCSGGTKAGGRELTRPRFS